MPFDFILTAYFRDDNACVVGGVGALAIEEPILSTCFFEGREVGDWCFARGIRGMRYSLK